MTYTLEELFSVVMVKTIKFRQISPNGDGIKFWNPIKTLLMQFDAIDDGCSWKRVSDKDVNRFMSLEEYFADGKINEINHFLIQQVRIPTTETISIRKIIQVALNIGQYIGCGYDRKNCYGTSIYDYVSEGDVARLSRYISRELINTIKEM